MSELFDILQLPPHHLAELPDPAAVLATLQERRASSAFDALRAADAAGRPFIQPRCGVGGHTEMVDLLRRLGAATPGMLSVTIDSYTRLKQFDSAARMLRDRPTDLNGYPLVAHGWQRGRELVDTVTVPLQVRHGSPDARMLFAVSLAAGMTSFEGGGISYNLPYSKDVPLEVSLAAWQQVDAACGLLARAGVVVDRELFGTLTAVLVPPSISLAITILEACAAARAGVTCISIAYPQGGEAYQDIAALRAIRSLADRYVGPGATVYPVLHEFMGVFPRRRINADALILYGGLIGRLGGATKVVCKTNQEAYGIPEVGATITGIHTAAIGTAPLLDFVQVDEARIAEEMYWIEREVGELIDPILACDNLTEGIVSAFQDGRLDVPFSASIHAKARVNPQRDHTGAIRFRDYGGLPVSAATRQRNAECLGASRHRSDRQLIDMISADIHYLAQDDMPSSSRSALTRRTP